jgi:hypothetical protein
MKRLLTAAAGLAALAVAAFGALAAAPTAVAAGPSCPSGDTVADVTQNVLNDDNAGVARNAWATTSYQRRIVIVRTGSHSFCAWAAISGKYRTYAGTSPGATGVVEAGIPGPFYGQWFSNVFSAKFRPSVPTSGILPTVDFGCDGFFNCPGFVDWRTYFFTDVYGFGLTFTREGFDASTYGRWYDINDASYGDITG